MNRLLAILSAVALYLSISIPTTAEEERQVRLHRFEQDGKFGFRDETGADGGTSTRGARSHTQGSSRRD